MNKKQEKGITLVALMITIIVLLILAGVTLNLTLGDKGIFKIASEAKTQTEIAEIKEQIGIEILEKQAENEGDISDSDLKEILEKYGILSNEEEKLIDKTLTTTKGNHEIKVSDIFNGVTVKKYPTFTTVANAPNITGFNKNNTYYVAWDLTSSPYSISDTTLISDIPPSNWYDYTEGVNQWANIKTTGGGNDCYWVWIPRYAYKITEGYHSNNVGNIDIKFLKGTTNVPIDGTNIEIKNQTGSGNWNVHPAFWFDKNNNGIEDEGEQLTGIWVAKFQASSSSSAVVENPTIEQLAIDGGSDADIDLKIRVRPNVTNWRNITANNIFTVCQNLTAEGNSLENTKNISSHLMKNTQWGAVAYLTKSKYGKNSEVWNNPYYNNLTEYSIITGLCGKGANDKDLSTTDINKTCKYNEEGGGNASTTGNVYGVYDMSGGSWEYVAGIYKTTSSSVIEDYNNKLWEPNNAKYVDQYTEATDSRENYYGNTKQYGDAVYETSRFGHNDNSSWESTFSRFPMPEVPVFRRGGHAHNGSQAGVFAFYNSHTIVNTWDSFRPAVINL